MNGTSWRRSPGSCTYQTCVVGLCLLLEKDQHFQQSTYKYCDIVWPNNLVSFRPHLKIMLMI